MTPPCGTMRDAFIGRICQLMEEDPRIFFLTADLGAPALDRIRERFPDRFVNVGIAEQNLVGVATGLALEGYRPYAYAIAPFLSMRAFEQIRVDLAISSQIRPVPVTLVGLGGGVSYQVSGPTHHALEDLALMRILPNLSLFSPADPQTARRLADHTLSLPGPSYVRLDGKALPDLQGEEPSFERGFRQLLAGERVCIVATGYMTHRAVEIASRHPGVGVIDLFSLTAFDGAELARALGAFRHVISLEEGFVGVGGMDALLSEVIRTHRLGVSLHPLGFRGRYLFDLAERNRLHEIAGFGDGEIVSLIARLGGE